MALRKVGEKALLAAEKHESKVPKTKQQTILNEDKYAEVRHNFRMSFIIAHQQFIFVIIGGFTVTSFAVSRGHPAPLVGKRFLAGGLRVYFCLDSCLVYINFAHTQDHDYVLYLCGGTSGVGWTACFSLLSSKKMENEENSG